MSLFDSERVKYQDLPEGPDEPYNKWWCATCNQWIDGSEVTYEETHDLRCGGCGGFVE